MAELNSGDIEEWKSEKQQKGGSGITVPMSIVDFATLVTSSPNASNVSHNNFTLTETQGSGSISGQDYYIGSYYDDNRIQPWLDSLGVSWYNYDYNTERFVIPYGNFFQGIDPKHPEICALYRNNKYNSFMNDTYTPTRDWAGGGSTSIADRYEQYYISLIGCQNDGKTYRGWVSYSYRVTTQQYDYHFCIWSIDSALNLLGSFTTEDTPVDDPQKGIPSLPIGAAGDVVTKALEEIQIPDKPVLGVSSLGTYNVYKVGLMDLTNFMSEIFHTTTRTNYSGNDFGELMATALINIDKGMNDLVKGDVTQFVVDTHIIPCTPETSAYTNIGIGGYITNSRGMPVTSDYIDVDCGAIRLGKGYTTHYDSFQDMSTRLKLYLPFIGYVDLDNNLIWKVKNQPQSIRVRYRFNVLDGSCMAFVSSGALGDGSTTSIIGVYSGSCCVHMPLTGANYSSVISGMIQTASGIATGLATGNPLTATMGIGNGLANLMKPNTTMSNSYNATSSFMGIRRPYLIIQKNTQNMPINFYERNGGLCMISYKLNDIKGSGFTKCANVDTNTFGNLKKHEKEELKRMLESGVYL